MAERIDHVATAVGATQNASRLLNGHEDAAAGAMATLAVAEATLALVEQQRIANLVAIAVSDKTSRATAEQFASEAIHLLKGERRGD